MDFSSLLAGINKGVFCGFQGMDASILDGISEESAKRDLDGSLGRPMDEALKKLRESISSEAARINSLGEALQVIANTSRETERLDME